MNLKSLFLGVLVLLIGVYCIVDGIRIYKKDIVISHTSERERFSFIWAIFILIQFTFIENNKVDYNGFIMGIIVIAIFVLYLIYSRLYDVKYRIYNIDQKQYEDIIKYTLNENGMEYSISYGNLEVKGTCMYIEFIDKGFLINRCKKVPNYQNFLNNLETNLKSFKVIKKKKTLITSILLGIFFIILSIAFLFPVLS